MTTSIQDELASLIDAERGRPEAGLEASDRVWSGVQGRLQGAPPPASVPAGAGWSPLAIVGGAVVVAGLLAMGWGLTRSEASPHFEAIPPAPPLDVTAVRPSPPHLRAELPREAAITPIPEEKPTARDATPRENQGSVADELALIERARTSLDRGQGKAALGVLNTHRRQFPKGAFVEEASALRASALCSTGRIDAASKAAAAFLRRYPKSVHVNRVRACEE